MPCQKQCQSRGFSEVGWLLGDTFGNVFLKSFLFNKYKNPMIINKIEKSWDSDKSAKLNGLELNWNLNNSIKNLHKP